MVVVVVVVVVVMVVVVVVVNRNARPSDCVTTSDCSYHS